MWLCTNHEATENEVGSEVIHRVTHQRGRPAITTKALAMLQQTLPDRAAFGWNLVM